MLEDCRVKSRRDEEVNEIARSTREAFGFGDVSRVDVVACLNSKSIMTVFGQKRLYFQALPDPEMGKDDGATTYGKDNNGRPFVKITVKESVFRDASLGLGRARMTLAHELGHAIMHEGVKMARRTLGNGTYASIAPYESAEHQAKVFAAALLIHPKIAENFHSDEELSVEFGVSFEAARVHLGQRRVSLAWREMGGRMRRFASEFAESVSAPRSALSFLEANCPICSRRTLFVVGHKFMCKSDTVFDRLQDGDPNFD
jgi:hypothetical protein